MADGLMPGSVAGMTSTGWWWHAWLCGWDDLRGWAQEVLWTENKRELNDEVPPF